MNYSVSGVNGNYDRITTQKSIQFTYTSEKKLLNNRDKEFVNNIDGNWNNIIHNNNRRIDQHGSDRWWESPTYTYLNNHHSDDKIVKYIERIICILSKDQDITDKYEFMSQDFPKHSPENLTLNKLLSLRLGQINRIKSLYVSRETGLAKKQFPSKRPEGCVMKYYPKKPILNLSEARNDYQLLTSCLKTLRWKSCNYNAGDILWLGFSVSFNQMCDIISRNKCVNYSKIGINRYPDISEMTKKSYFYHLLDTYSAYLGENQCFPKSFKLPDDLKKVIKSLDKHVPLIFKPSNGSMGQGVKVVTSPYDISDELLVGYAAQEYISSPLLLGGKKFDIRVYLLLIGESKALIYKNSLVRICTEEYEYPSPSNSKNNFMHLTNYSINKSNVSSYHRGDVGDERNNKQMLPSVLENLEDMGYNTEDIWSQIVNICSLVCGTMYPEIQLSSRLTTSKSKKLRRMPNYFQILGLDVIIDTYGKAWLLEVNSCPSLKTNYFDGKNFREDSVDLKIKVPLVTGALNLVHLHEHSHKHTHLESNYTINGKTNNTNYDTDGNGMPHTGIKDCMDEARDWQGVEIGVSSKLENLMALFRIAKGDKWETNTLSKREWMCFCTQGGILNIANLIVIVRGIYNEPGNKDRNGLTNVDENKYDDNKIKKENWGSGKGIISQMFSESIGRHGREGENRLYFSYFVHILGLISNLVNQWIKKINKEIIYNICKKYNIIVELDVLDWKISQPHNSIKNLRREVSEDFLKLLNYNFNI